MHEEDIRCDFEAPAKKGFYRHLDESIRCIREM